jgi:hypothetical protein
MKKLLRKIKKEENIKKIGVWFFIFLFVASTLGSILVYFI